MCKLTFEKTFDLYNYQSHDAVGLINNCIVLSVVNMMMLIIAL